MFLRSMPQLLLSLPISLLLINQAVAGTVFTNDTFPGWDAMVDKNGIPFDLGTVLLGGLDFSDTALVNANEVTSPPAENQGLGNVLTFSLVTPSSATWRIIATEANNFVWSDDEPGTDPVGNWEFYLSIGDIDNDENDNLRIEVLAGDVYGVYMDLFGNTDFDAALRFLAQRHGSSGERAA